MGSSARRRWMAILGSVCWLGVGTYVRQGKRGGFPRAVKGLSIPSDA